MLILPAIDIRDGKCVRLYQGKADQETIYSEDPLEVARHWKSKGAAMLHLVDLDGAFTGKPVNLELAGAIRKEVDLPVELGGGFRTMEAIELAITHRIDRVILGTAAITHPQLVAEAVRLYGNRIAVSIDVSGSFATTAGWTEVSGIPFGDVAAGMRELGLEELLFTDTKRDGTLLGPDIPTIQRFLDAAQIPVTISGGISCLDDIQALKKLEPSGVKAVVIGKALYDKKIQLEDALRIA